MFKIVLFVIIGIVLFVFIRRIKEIFSFSVPTGLSLFIGPPGSGKTTLCACMAKLALSSTVKEVVSNVPIKGCGILELGGDGKPSDFELYNFTNVDTVIVDEAGIVYNNRKFKSLSQATIEFAKMFRHHHITSFVLVSQSVDIDVTFYRLCEHIFLVHRAPLRNFVMIREVAKDTDLDDLSHQIVDFHQYVKHGTHLVYMPSYWNMFDSYELSPKPEKQWQHWGSSSRYEDVAFIDKDNIIKNIYNNIKLSLTNFYKVLYTRIVK